MITRVVRLNQALPMSGMHQSRCGASRLAPGSIGYSLEPCRLTVAAGITGREVSVVEPPDRLAAPELVVVIHRDEFVAASAKLLDRCRRKVLFEAHLHSLNPAEARPVTGRLRILAVIGDAHQDLYMPLRLHASTHDTEADHRCTCFCDDAGNDGVVRTLVRPDLVGVPGGCYEIRATVVQ